MTRCFIQQKSKTFLFCFLHLNFCCRILDHSKTFNKTILDVGFFHFSLEITNCVRCFFCITPTQDVPDFGSNASVKDVSCGPAIYFSSKKGFVCPNTISLQSCQQQRSFQRTSQTTVSSESLQPMKWGFWKMWTQGSTQELRFCKGFYLIKKYCCQFIGQ